jgi:hypothetical protein
MYLAEIQGKFTPSEERKEDILTSDVFSFFKYAKREVFLYQLLKYLQLDVVKNDVVNAEFIFWPSYEDGTQPDLIILVGKYYLLIEAKFSSGFGRSIDFKRHQLIREIEGGKLEAQNLNIEFQIIAVTAHYTKHHFYYDNPEFSNYKIIWLNWHRIALIIYETLSRSKTLDSETLCFAEDLYKLLAKKKLRKYAGIEILEDINQIAFPPALLFFNSATAQYRGDFLGFMDALGVLSKMLRACKYVFFKSKAIFLKFDSVDLIINAPETIFFGGKNE